MATGPPAFDAAGGPWILRQVAWRGAVDLRDKRGLLPCKERLHTVVGSDERERELGIWCGSNHHQQSHVVPLNRREFVGLVPDPRVVGQGDPSPLPNRVQPLFVRAAVSLEVIPESLDGESGVPQDLAERRSSRSLVEGGVLHECGR